MAQMSVSQPSRRSLACFDVFVCVCGLQGVLGASDWLKERHSKRMSIWTLSKTQVEPARLGRADPEEFWGIKPPPQKETNTKYSEKTKLRGLPDRLSRD